MVDKPKYKAVILNQCTVYQPFEKINQVSLDTWVKEFRDNDILLINYYGGYDNNGTALTRFNQIPNKNESIFYTEGGLNYLIVGCEDYINTEIQFDPRGLKQILAFEYCINNFDFDIIYKTTCNSYNILSEVKKWIYRMPLKGVYAGCKNAYFVDPVNEKGLFYFVVGCSVFFSKDIINIILDNKQRYLELTEKNLLAGSYEDVVIGRLLNYELQLINIHSDFQINTPYTPNYKSLTKDMITEKIIIPEVFTYRFSPDEPKVMMEFHNLIK
jgi:hypothetical protein